MFFMRIRFLTLLSFVCCSFSFAQVFSADSLHSPVDSLHTDSLHTVKDSSSVKGIDTVVTYTCTDSIVYTLSNKTMSLYKKGDIKYQQMQLQSERIHVNWNTSVMTAEGIPDSADTTKKKFKGTPIMKDGGEEFHGFELGYNFKTKKGKINVADTHSDEGYYHGEDIKKVEQDVLFIENGRYTTCDAPEPHYYFASPKMKVLLRDKVIAQPVYFYIADVPLFALPLGVFPSKGGRRSGIIAPAIVEDAAHGRLLRHLGYYFAISDYMDINFRSDLYTKGSWALYSDYRYNLRYYFNGSLSGEYKKLIEGESADPARSVNEAYSLNFTHSQVIDPTASFNVNFTFASNNSYLNTINQNQLLNQSIRSQATLNKLWDEKNSSSISVTRTQNLVDGSVFETLPSLSFSHSGSYPFRFGRKVAADLSDLSWYETIVFSYSANASNNRSKFTRKINGIKTDINGVLTPQTIEETEHDNNQNLSQSLGFGISPKLGYFTISPNLSYSDQRSFSSNEVPGRNDADSSIIFTTVRQSSRTGIIT
jgi:lipopolysaccharide assembly outer membrane protein LptD (OstA)